MEELSQVLHPFQDVECGSKQYDRIDFRETADMVEGSTDDEHEVVAELLTIDEVLGIAHDGPMTDHDPLRLAGGASGEKYVSRSGRNHGSS